MRRIFRILFVTVITEDYSRIEGAVLDSCYRLEDLIPEISFEFTSMRNLIEGSNFTETLLEDVQNSDLIICNISKHYYSSMYELGLAHALNKPTIILVDNEARFNFDMNSVRYIAYDQNSLETSFIPHLVKILSIAVTEPEMWKLNFHEEGKKEKKDNRKTVFVSYSHKDFIYLDRIKIHLKPIERKGLVDLWSDTLILSGEKWKDKIEAALEKAAIAILLLSADFMASDFIVDKELQPLLKTAESNGTIIIPVIVKPCRFLREPSISQFQATNDPINPLCKLSEFEQEEIYEKISHRIELALGSE